MTLPIKKTIIASLAFIIVHWRKVLEISIIPLIFALPLLFVLPELVALSKQLFIGQVDANVVVPDNTLLYMSFFLFGYAMLSINLARLTMLGAESVSVISGVFEFVKIVKYIGLSMLIGLAIVFPVALTGLVLVQLVVHFLIVPLTLNFVNVSLGRALNLRWKLPFVIHVNLFLMQVLLPTLFVYLFSIVADVLSLHTYVYLFVQVIIFYWSGINLAFCYRLIASESSTQNL